MRIRGTGVRLAVLAAGLAGLAPAALAGSGAAATAVASSTATWHVVASTKTAFLSALAAPSRTDVWALGTGIVTGRPEEGFPFGLHWNGRSWTKASFPRAISKTGIGCAGATAPNDIWAFAGTSSGGSSAAAAGALRLVNGRWKLVKAFPAGIVTGCLVVSPTQVWVFGDAHVAPGVGLWHLHGTTWTRITSLRYALATASAIGPDDIWAEGEDSFAFPVVARWNGRSWIRNTALTRALPKPSSSLEVGFDGITAISDRNVWLRVVVSKFSGANRSDSLLVLHWSGRSWQKVSSSNPGYFLPGAVRDGRGGWWSVIPADSFGHLPSGVWHQVSGHWVKVPVKIAACPAALPYLLSNATGSATMLGLQACPAKSATAYNVLAYGPLR
jgi:hypothetical protein